MISEKAVFAVQTVGRVDGEKAYFTHGTFDTLRKAYRWGAEHIGVHKFLVSRIEMVTALDERISYRARGTMSLVWDPKGFCEAQKLHTL